MKHTLLACLLCLLCILTPAYSQGAEVLIAANAGVQNATPENTMVALELAVEQGANALKIDVRSTKDGMLVLMCDETIDRTTNGFGTLRNILFDELQLYDAGSWLSDRFKGETVPLLREVLRFAKLNHLKLILDVHEHGLEKPILSLLQSTDMMRDVYLWGTLSNLREIEPSIVGPKLLFISVDNLTPAEIDDAHASGAQVMTSLLNCDDREWIKKVARLGPDIILVDYPAVAAEALGRFGEKPANIKRIKKRVALVDRLQTDLPSDSPAEPQEIPVEEKEGFDLFDPVSSLYNFLLGERSKKEDLGVTQEKLSPELREKLVALRHALKEPGLEEKGFFARSWRAINKGLEEGEVEESRKAALVLATFPPEAALPALLKALEYKRPAVRANAAWALGLLGDPRALTNLTNHLWDKDIVVQREATLALGRLKRPEAVEPLRKVLTSKKMEPTVVYDAARALGWIGSPEATWDLIRVMERNQDWQVKGACARALGRIGEERIEGPLGKVLLQEHGDPAASWTRDLAIWALSELKEPPSNTFLEMLRFTNASTKSRACWAMVRMGEASIPILTRALRDPHPEIRRRAAETMGWLGNDKAVPSLIRIAKEDPPQPDKVRRSAVWALGKIGDPRAEKVLDEIIRNEDDKEIKETAEEAILRLTQR